MNALTSYTPILDKFAVSTSAICAIHCLFLPILITLFPALGATIIGQELFHVLLLWLVIPLSFFALSMGCRSHKNWLVALLGLAGLSLLVTAVGLGHDFLGEDGERLATLLGAILISCAHIRNYMLCRRAACDR